MKKAVIMTGGKQYLVSEGQVLDVDLFAEGKSANFEPLLIIDEDQISVGQPAVAGAKVSADVVEPMIKGEKVIAIRYKAKKRVKKVRGHRQQFTKIKIKSISTSAK